MLRSSCPSPRPLLAIFVAEHAGCRRAEVALRALLAGAPERLCILTRDASGLPADAAFAEVSAVGDGGLPAASWRLAREGAARGFDVLLCDAAVVLPTGWRDALAGACYSGRFTASASPLMEHCRLFSPGAEACLARELATRWLASQPEFAQEIPLPHAACAYWRADALSLAESCPDFASADAWLSQRGYCHVLSSRVFADASESSWAQWGSLVDARADVTAFNLAHPLTGLRFRLAEFLTAVRSIPAEAAKPVQLHVMHSWGGGLEKWVRDYCGADETRINLILKSIGTWGAFGQRLALYAHVDAKEPLRVWELPLAIAATVVHHRRYREILEEVIRDFGVGGIVVSSFIGHSLDILELPLPTLVVAHDYYPYCPALSIYFEGICARCDGGRLALCRDRNPLNSFFRELPPAHWQALREAYVAKLVRRRLPVVAPSRSVCDNLRRLMPAMAEVDMRVIGHGLPQPMPERLPVPQPSERLRLVVLGSLAGNKGGVLFSAVAERLAAQADVLLLGCGPEGKAYEGLGMRCIERYQAHELRGLLAEFAPDLGLLPAVIPETFSYTLSELFCFGIPPLLTATGSYPERVEDGVSGFLCAPEPSALCDMLIALSREPERIARVRQNLQTFTHKSLPAMVAEYHACLPLVGPGHAFWALDPGSGGQPGAGEVSGDVPGLGMPEMVRHFETQLQNRLDKNPRLTPRLSWLARAFLRLWFAPLTRLARRLHAG